MIMNEELSFIYKKYTSFIYKYSAFKQLCFIISIDYWLRYAFPSKKRQFFKKCLIIVQN